MEKKETHMEHSTQLKHRKQSQFIYLYPGGMAYSCCDAYNNKTYLIGILFCFVFIFKREFVEPYCRSLKPFPQMHPIFYHQSCVCQPWQLEDVWTQHTGFNKIEKLYTTVLPFGSKVF